MLILISEIKVSPGRRGIVPKDVQALADSISGVGLINPIMVDQTNTLIAGLHRLEAAKLLGWTEIECTVSSLGGLQAELAELDENFVHSDLSGLEYSDMLLRRKEIYEMLHPETKNGGDKKSEEIRTSKCRCDSAKPFTQDTAEKLGIGRRTVERQIQTAKNLTDAAKEIIRNSDAKITKTDALKLSRLPPEQQADAAEQLASEKIHSVDEYQTDPIEPLEDPPAPRSVPYSLGDKHFATLEESIADLKDPNKDCHYTLDAMLADMDGFVDRFHHDFEWYTWPVCTEFFPQLSQVQFEFVQERFDTIIAEIKKLIKLMKKELKK